jgi:serine/threonine-protein kinase HipA
MVTSKPVDCLNVLMNGICVGQLTKLPTGAIAFQYDRQWLAAPGTRPLSLSLPLRQDMYQGENVYNFFDNLLPDSDRTRGDILPRQAEYSYDVGIFAAR